MRKLLILSYIFTIVLLTGTAQTPVWLEKFKSPEGWDLEDNWNISQGMLYFDWNPTLYGFDQSAKGPTITVDDQVEELIVTQNLLVYNPSETETAQIIIISGEQETVVWEYTLDNGNWGDPQGSEITFPLEQFAGQTIHVKFRTFGESTFNWSWWQVTDVRIIATYDYDLMASNIDGPKNMAVLETGDWMVEVTNLGINTVEAYSIQLFDAKSGSIVNEVYSTDPIGSGETTIVGFDWTPNAAYNTLMYGVIEATEDQFSGNDFSDGKFLRIEPEIDYSILVWDNDNGIQSIICPEKGDLITPATGLLRAMDDAGLEYDLVSYLPEDLNSYDIVIGTLGNYCLS